MLLPNKKGKLKKRPIEDIHPRPTTIILKKLLSLKKHYQTQLIASSATVDCELKEELINMGWGQDVEMISTTESSSGLVSPNTIEY